MTEIKLRDYQSEAIDAVFKAWGDGMRRPAVVLPTGAGKTVVFSALVKRFRGKQNGPLDQFKVDPKAGSRVMVLAHRDELVDQAMAKLRAVLPEDVTVGKVKAGDNQITSDVIVASVQTLANARRREQVQYSEVSHGPVGLIITDECHHAAAASYQALYDAFPDALNLGVTATMARGDGVGLGDIWDDVVYQRSILNLVSKGHLVDVRTKRVELTNLDLSTVKASRGDWQAGDLGQALMDAQADTAIAKVYREHAGDRRGIVFTPTVATAHATADALHNAGVRSEVISGMTHSEDRRHAYEDFRTGRTQVLVNCMVLTEGFDAPWAEVAVIARPTQSAPLYTQMVGRVLRPWPGKKEALVLDLAGSSELHRLRTLVDLEPGRVMSVRDGESLAEAAIREAEEGDQKVPAGSLAFELRVRDVNAFAASGPAGSRTPGGVMFVNCGDTYVLLWPAEKRPDGEPGTWDVCVAPKIGSWQRTQYQGLDLGSAMAWGEAVAEDYAEFSVSRSASWRKAKPSDAQLSFALGLGIAGAESMRRGQLSEAIDAIQAARRLDRFVVKG